MEMETLTHNRSITVEEKQEAYVIQVRSRTLDLEASADVRTACLRGLDHGVSHVFVDLTGVRTMCDEAADLLEAAAEELLAKAGTLWLANLEDSPEWRPVSRHGLAQLAGMSPALVSALAPGTDVLTIQGDGDRKEGR